MKKIQLYLLYIIHIHVRKLPNFTAVLCLSVSHGLCLCLNLSVCLKIILTNLKSDTVDEDTNGSPVVSSYTKSCYPPVCSRRLICVSIHCKYIGKACGVCLPLSADNQGLTSHQLHNSDISIIYSVCVHFSPPKLPQVHERVAVFL